MPVDPAAAVGGMIAPGDRVDVYQTPLPGHDSAGPATAAAAPAGSAQSAAVIGPAAARKLGSEVLVLELRSDQGTPLGAQSSDSVHGLDFGSGKLGSVVLAVPEAEVPAFAAAVAGGAIYLALTVG